MKFGSAKSTQLTQLSLSSKLFQQMSCLDVAYKGIHASLADLHFEWIRKPFKVEIIHTAVEKQKYL